MAQVSPPKPWERGGSGGTRTMSTPSTATSTTSTAPTAAASIPSTSSSSSSAPAIPERPSTLSSVVNQTASNYTNTANSTSTALTRPYGSSPYGYGGGMSSYSSPYSSPYSRFGGVGGGMYGSSMYGGGMGGMYGGGMYGGGGGMYGGGMYGNQGGMPGDPNASLTNNFAQSTQATFQIIESIVGAFGGFAQMLESTYMATHSSFFAMVSVAEQFGNLRQTLGSVLGIYTLLRWTRTLLARITGRPPPADATSLTPTNFFAFTGGTPDPSHPTPPRPSKKPFVVFLLAVFGLPYLMGKLIRALAKGQEEAQAAAAAAAAQQNGHPILGPDGQPIPPGPQQQFDPTKLDFCRVLYDFPPPEAVASGSFDGGLDLQVRKGDLVAVLEKAGGGGGGNGEADAAGWWRCRARDGRVGWLPAVYLETIQRRAAPAIAPQGQITAGSAPGSRANTMPGSMTAAGVGTASGAGSRAQTMGSSVSTLQGSGGVAGSRAGSLKGKGGGGAGGVEGFQKAWVNDR